jgi:hypothetical protein
MTGGVGGVLGLLAEHAVIGAALPAHKPANLSMRQVAALPLVTITAWEGGAGCSHLWRLATQTSAAAASVAAETRKPVATKPAGVVQAVAFREMALPTRILTSARISAGWPRHGTLASLMYLAPWGVNRSIQVVCHGIKWPVA